MLRSTIKLVAAMSRIERTILGVLAGVLCVSLGVLMLQFYHENTVFVGVQGGTYIEGSVGEVRPLNPWFVTGNDVNREIGRAHV